MIGWAVETIAAATLLMLLVLVLRGPVARRFGPQAAYALWALPARAERRTGGRLVGTCADPPHRPRMDL